MLIDTVEITLRRAGQHASLLCQGRPMGIVVTVTQEQLDHLIAEFTHFSAQWRAATVRDPYKILGVERGASDAEIKRAYRKMARQHHPDLRTGETQKKAAEEKFTAVNDAYETLSDQEKRRQCDQLAVSE